MKPPACSLDEALRQALRARPDLKWSLVVSALILPGTFAWASWVAPFGDVLLLVMLIVGGPFVSLFWLMLLRNAADKFLHPDWP